MNYELSKQLKEAGYPQHKTSYSYRNHHIRGVEVAHEDSATGEFLCDLPELSELIEACGEDFVALVRWNYNNISYVASNCERDTPMVEKGLDINGEGSTPEIAVAHLWLALNKK